MTTKDYWGLEQTPPPQDTSGDFYTRLRDGTSREILYDHASYPNARVPLNSGTSFPVNPFVGQTFVYQVDRANGVYWQFIYLPDETVYPWKYVGGPPLQSLTAASDTRTNTAYGDLGGVPAPIITLPLVGDYDIEVGCRLNNNTAAAGAWMSYDDAAAASDTNGIEVFSTPGLVTITAYRRHRRTDLGAIALTAKYRTNVAGTATFYDRRLAATPVRVRV